MERRSTDSGLRSARAVGLIILPIGLALVIAPGRVAHWLRLGDHATALRTIGVSDLVLVPGLLAGRRRAEWMAARVGLNLLIAGYCLRLARNEGLVAAKIAAAAMVTATVADTGTIIALRRERRAA